MSLQTLNLSQYVFRLGLHFKVCQFTVLVVYNTHLVFYGTQHLGANYGWMFTAYGAGGLFGPFLAAWLMKVEAKVPYQVMEPGGKLVERQFAVGNYRPAFLVAGLACLVAATACLLLRAPRSARVVAPDAKESSVA